MPRTTQRDPLEEAVIGFQDGRLDADALARFSYPFLSRIGKAAAYELGLSDEDADLVHQLWFIMVNKIALEYDRARPIYPMLMTYARNIGRNILWQKRATPSLPKIIEPNGYENVEEQLADYFGPYWENASETDQGRSERKMLLDKIAVALSKVSISSKRNPARRNGLVQGVKIVPSITIPTATKPAAKKQPKRKVLTPEQKRIVEVRMALGMTQPEFADALNIEVPRLSSWEYGRTKSVPDWVPEAVEALMRNGNAKYEKAQKLFGNKKMSQIVDQWRKQLHIEEGDIFSLAHVIGVSEPTIRRWYADEVRPTIQSLIDYNEVVAKQAKILSAKASALASRPKKA